MAGTRGRTREQLRKSIGRNLIGHRLIDSAASSNDSAGGLIDDTLLGGDDNYNGWWIVVNSPEANRGSIRRISDYDSDANRLVWLRPLAEATAAGNRYELWPPEYPPPIIHDYIDQSIRETCGRIYAPVEDYSLHADGADSRFAVPTRVDAVFEVQVRASAASQSIHQMSAVFDETVDAEWTQSIDTAGHRGGVSALRIDISAQAENGDFISDSVLPVDLSRSTHVEGWMRSERELAAGDVVLHLNDGPARADGSDAESLRMPGCPAGRWTYFRADVQSMGRRRSHFDLHRVPCEHQGRRVVVRGHPSRRLWLCRVAHPACDGVGHRARKPLLDAHGCGPPRGGIRSAQDRGRGGSSSAVH